ncbi:MAG: cytochrome c [Pirellula sp.]
MTTYQEEQLPIPTPWRLVRELRLKRPPWWMIVGLVSVVVATWIPLTLIYEARGTKSRSPRIHFFLDMDKQAKFKPQSSHPWYLDGRAMRLPLEGTMASGRLKHDQHYCLGYFTNDGTTGSPVKEFATSLPSQLQGNLDILIARGRERYGIYCTVCHGEFGAGDGPVNQRAIELKETKWVPTTNLMTQMVRDRADGQLFQAITDGVRNMPSYGAQCSTRDRWAIVAYVRHMQSVQPVAPEPAPATLILPGK